MEKEKITVEELYSMWLKEDMDDVMPFDNFREDASEKYEVIG